MQIQAIDMKNYPFKKVVAANTLYGVQFIPKKIVDYLLYTNGKGASLPDDNTNPRCRLLKYLFNDKDDLRPLSGPLPTLEERVNAVFDPKAAIKNGNEGPQYRIFPQMYTAQAQLIANTMFRVFVGYIRPGGEISDPSPVSVVFEVLTSVYYDQLDEEGMSRTLGMVQCIVEALNGINIGGIGSVAFESGLHKSCEIYPIGDRGTNVGYRMVLCTDMLGEGTDDVCPV